jgi:phosphatidylglycerophosphate synthase
MNRERLQRIRNFQSEDWYPALVIRPLTILVMLAIADVKLLTPNRVTTLANLTKLTAAWLILDQSHWLCAALLLQVGLIFDHLDGTIARYRRTLTKFGSFYDKASDMIMWTVIMLAVGWKETLLTGDAKWTVLASASALALNVRGYTKWLEVAEGERARWLEARTDPAAAVAKRTAPITIAPPPERTGRDWAIWFAKKILIVFYFEEADLWFWLGLGLVIERLDLAIWLLAATQVVGMIGLVIKRGLAMARLDRKIAELER